MRFFFYGTLIAGTDNPVARAVHARLRDLGPAVARGRLFAIPDPGGCYPALLAGEGRVHGRLYEAAGFADGDLALLDGWEDYDPGRPGASLYLRRPMAVTCPDGTRLTAEAYRYNRPLPRGARRIAGGDFAAWFAAGGVKTLVPRLGKPLRVGT